MRARLFIALAFFACGGRTGLGIVQWEDASVVDVWVDDQDTDISNDASIEPDAADAAVHFPPLLALGQSHSCAELPNGSVRCWGNNSVGQLGNGTLTEHHRPVDVVDIFGVTLLSSGINHACAVVQFGNVYCWGDGARTPLFVNGLSNVVSVAAGDAHSCAVDKNGHAYCWGSNDDGQLGDGTFVSRAQPTLVPLSFPTRSIAAGAHHTCAIRASDGVPFCWGRWAFHPPTPIAQPIPGLTNVVELALGTDFTCARTKDLSVLCFGANQHGELGDGTLVDAPSPRVVFGSGLVRQVAAKETHVCALMWNQVVECWGDGVLSASAVPGMTPIVTIGVGSHHACAQHSFDDQVVCWGSNSNGQLGDGTTTDHAAPAPVMW